MDIPNDSNVQMGTCHPSPCFHRQHHLAPPPPPPSLAMSHLGQPESSVGATNYEVFNISV